MLRLDTLSCVWLGLSLGCCVLLGAREIAAQPAAGRPEPVAVVPFETTTALPTEARLATERVREELLATQKFSIVENAKIEQALQALKVDKSGCIVVQCAVAIGKALGVRRVVTGSLTLKQANQWVVSGFLVDVDKGVPLRASTVESEGGSLSFISDAVAVVAARLAEVPPPAELLAAGQIKEQAPAKQEELRPKAAAPPPERRNPMWGFGLSSGMASHTGTLKSAGASAAYKTYAVPTLGLDYQWPLGTSLSVSAFFLAAGGGVQGVLGDYYDSAGHGVLGAELRYWLGNTYLGGHLGSYGTTLMDSGSGRKANSTVQISGFGAGLVGGYEWTSGWFLGASLDLAPSDLTKIAKPVVARQSNSDPAPVTLDGNVEETAIWINIGYRWK